MKVKWLLISMLGLTLSTGTALAVVAQTPAATDLTNPTTDFGRDVKDGIESTKNDAVAKEQQKDAEDNESEEGREENEKAEVKEAAETPEVPEASETPEAPEVKNESESEQNKTESSSSGVDSEENTASSSTVTSGGTDGE